MTDIGGASGPNAAIVLRSQAGPGGHPAVRAAHGAESPPGWPLTVRVKGAMALDALGTATPWLVVWLAAVALNAVPAFMPPTWSLLAYFHLAHGLGVVPLAVVGAAGATTGRLLLALGSRFFGDRFVPAANRENLAALADELGSRPALAASSLVLFALGPVPTNQLFVAAGLARAPLGPLLAVFGVARFVSYLLWVGAAEVAARTLRDAISPSLGGWAAVVAQIGGFALIVVASRIDWARVVARLRPPSPPADPRDDPS